MSITRPIAGRVAQPIPRALNAPGVGGGGSFDPASLFSSGEKGVVFDFSSASNLFQDSARTTPVTSVSDPIGSVTDLSPNAKHASQATAGSRPLWQGDSGLFDGADDRLVTASIDFTGTDAVTVIACIRKASDAAIGLVVELGSGGLNGSFLLNTPASAGLAGAAFTSRGTANGTAVVTTGVSALTDYVISGVGRVSTDTSLLRVNSTQVASSAVDQGTGNYSNNPLYIGRRGVNTNPFNGRIYRLIVIGRHLTADELADAEAWVAGPLV